MADIRITGRMVNFSRLTFDTNDHNAIISNTPSMKVLILERSHY